MGENNNVYNVLVGELEGKNTQKYSMASSVPTFKEFTVIKQISVCICVCVCVCVCACIYIYIYIRYCGPGSSGGIATDYGLDGPGSNPGGGEIFRPSRPALGPTQHPVKRVPGLSRR